MASGSKLVTKSGGKTSEPGVTRKPVVAGGKPPIKSALKPPVKMIKGKATTSGGKPKSLASKRSDSDEDDDSEEDDDEDDSEESSDDDSDDHSKKTSKKPLAGGKKPVLKPGAVRNPIGGARPPRPAIITRPGVPTQPFRPVAPRILFTPRTQARPPTPGGTTPPRPTGEGPGFPVRPPLAPNVPATSAADSQSPAIPGPNNPPANYQGPPPAGPPNNFPGGHPGNPANPATMGPNYHMPPNDRLQAKLLTFLSSPSTSDRHKVLIIHI
ncbi:WW domain-binding protein 11-like [Diaphorina citri]|uniref:WW domain-binding protein 11-like n=1 Tax=Diaphorina citri TaxID=121845 RepID=A0A1S3D9M8_DIACI|nr:WW domain-binding protein 11-like [Diaphorina citri]